LGSKIFFWSFYAGDRPHRPPWTHHWLQRHMTGCFSAFYVNTCACHVYFTVNLQVYFLTYKEQRKLYSVVTPVFLLWLLNSTSNFVTMFVLVLHVFSIYRPLDRCQEEERRPKATRLRGLVYTDRASAGQIIETLAHLCHTISLLRIATDLRRQQVCVEPPPSALGATLSAFAAEVNSASHPSGVA